MGMLPSCLGNSTVRTISLHQCNNPQNLASTISPNIKGHVLLAEGGFIIPIQGHVL